MSRKFNDIVFPEMDNTYFLIGLLNEFMNRLQTTGDAYLKEISWKQFFLLVCVRLFEQPPTLKELSTAFGCSHQNVKQMLLKLERNGYVKLITDDEDRRKQRVITTKETDKYMNEHDETSAVYMKGIFENIDEKDLEITVKTIMHMDMNLKEIQ